MKYVVSYTSGATGFGWVRECETIEEVKSITWGSDVPVEYQSDV